MTRALHKSGRLTRKVRRGMKGGVARPPRNTRRFHKRLNLPGPFRRQGIATERRNFATLTANRRKANEFQEQMTKPSSGLLNIPGRNNNVGMVNGLPEPMPQPPNAARQVETNGERMAREIQTRLNALRN